MKKNVHPLGLVYKLAEDHAVVLLNGGGFDAPNWSVRVSFANLPDEAYEDIGRAVRAASRDGGRDQQAMSWTDWTAPRRDVHRKFGVLWSVPIGDLELRCTY